ncbi:MAG TPA: cytochrome b/b6 domain-containing protein, partial [Acetobacteraceae bacterium]|nr:cytochrome b/b6 domain-containing protein [Acetobacteraceae bacterium]
MIPPEKMADGEAAMASSGRVQRVAVWDPWIRLVHWTIVLLIPFSYWTARTDRWEWHYRAGYVLLALVLFRIAWGIVGSDTARFARFLKSPLAALRHLGEIRR